MNVTVFEDLSIYLYAYVFTYLHMEISTLIFHGILKNIFRVEIEDTQKRYAVCKRLTGINTLPPHTEEFQSPGIGMKVLALGDA